MRLYVQNLAKRLLSALLVLAAAFALGLCAPHASYADDPESNYVDEQQLPDSSFLYDTSLVELASADPYYDNQTVKVLGEAVGDKLRVGLEKGHRWILVEAIDGSGATVSVYVTDAQAAQIDTLGAYGKTGSIVQVQGTFNLTCLEHDGLTDLHADTLMVTKPGSDEKPAFNYRSFIPGLVLVVIGGLLSFIFFRLRESRR